MTLIKTSIMLLIMLSLIKTCLFELFKQYRIQRKMEEDTTRLFNAVRDPNPEQIQNCLDKGVDVNSLREGYNSLHLAVDLHKQGYDAKPVILFLLNRGIDADLGTEKGNSALHIASRKNFPDIVQILLEFGVDKDRKNENEESALYIAANLNHVEITKLLLQSGAKTTEVNRDGFTPLLQSIKEHNLEVIEIIIEDGGNIKLELVML